MLLTSELRCWLLLLAVGFVPEQAIAADGGAAEPAPTVSAPGGEYRDPATGVSFQYPAGWVAVAPEVLGNLESELPAGIRTWMANNRDSLQKLKVAVVRVGEEDFLENVNLVIHPRENRIDETGRQRMQRELEKMYRSMGMQILASTSKLGHWAGRTGMFYEQVVRLPGQSPVDPPLKQRQYFLTGGGLSFIFTYSSTDREFARYEPIAEALVASLQAPPPQGVGFGGGRPNDLAFRVGQIAGGLAVPFLIAVFFFARGKKAPRKVAVKATSSRPAPKKPTVKKKPLRPLDDID